MSIWEDLRAPNTTVVDGNCGALDAVLTCETHLAHRRADAFLVGGGDVVSEPLYAAFRKLGAIAEGDAVSKPANEESTGIPHGRGRGLLGLRAAQRRRGPRRPHPRRHRRLRQPPSSPPPKTPSCSTPPPSPIGRAIRIALADAGIPASSVSLVCASASGLLRYDAAELHAIEQVIGTDVAVVAPKALFGEAFAGSAAMGMAAACAWIDGVAPSPLVSGRAPERVDVVVVTAVGYYGNASAVVIKRA